MLRESGPLVFRTVVKGKLVDKIVTICHSWKVSTVSEGRLAVQLSPCNNSSFIVPFQYSAPPVCMYSN